MRWLKRVMENDTVTCPAGRLPAGPWSADFSV